MYINAQNMHFKNLNEQIRACTDNEIIIDKCNGQRYIGTGQSGKNIVINGTCGNALGSYLDGCHITINGNAQDATGDTMNDGTIIINGNCGDTCGYSMRGGKIFVKGNAGYRVGIHMKGYMEKKPAIIVGGSAGSFLGEYQAGGVIIVLGLNTSGKPPVGFFCGTGMHGGKMFLRCDTPPRNLPPQVLVHQALQDDLEEISPIIREFCDRFSKDYNIIMNSKFQVLSPNTKNPYKQLYTHN